MISISFLIPKRTYINRSCILVKTLQISEEEITFLTGGDDPYSDEVVLKKLFHPNLKLLIVTEGSEGCRYYTKVPLYAFLLKFKASVEIEFSHIASSVLLQELLFLVLITFLIL